MSNADAENKFNFYSCMSIRLNYISCIEKKLSFT